MKRRPLADLVIPVETWNPGRSGPEESFQYIDLGAVDQETKSIVGARSVACADAPSRARQLIKARDILVSTVRPNLNGVAKVPDEFGGATASTGFCVVRPKPELLDSSYLFHWVKSTEFVSEMVKEATGASYPAVSDRIVLASRIPIPPLPEQRRIAAILDQAEALRAKRREALALLDELQRGIFIEMFGDPVTSPKGCAPATLGDCVEEMQYGPRFYNEAYSDDGIRIVRITDLDGAGDLDFDAMPRMDVDEETRTKFTLSAGDIVFARTGATVGKVALIKEHDPECIAGAYFIRMQFQSRILPEYAFSVLQSKSVQSLIVAQSRQAAQQNFSGPGLRRLPMPVPPLERQRQFAKRLEAIGREKRRQSAGLDLLDELFKSLQHRAFRGEL